MLLVFLQMLYQNNNIHVDAKYCDTQNVVESYVVNCGQNKLSQKILPQHMLITSRSTHSKELVMGFCFVYEDLMDL